MTPQPTPQLELDKFSDAVRMKKDWAIKVLDQERKLGLKWAVEAKLLSGIEENNHGGAIANSNRSKVLDTIHDLQVEACCIRFADYTLRLQPLSLPQRSLDWERIEIDIKNALKYLRVAQYAIAPPPLKEQVGVYISDGAVPFSLHQELARELDALEEVGPKDFHPGTNETVRNLIHPSLYPYIAGVTPVTDLTRAPILPDGLFCTEIVNNENSQHIKSRYAWIPSVFRLSEDGADVHIESYINGLGPRERFPVLYRLIEKVFLLALPHFEKTLGFKYQFSDSPSVARWHAREGARGGTTQEEWEALLARQKEKKANEETAKIHRLKSEEDAARLERKNMSEIIEKDNSSSPATELGPTLKVIVKAANYVLTPGQEYQGTWHIEGQPHERIVASAIYYYDTDAAISDSGLSLRRMRGSGEFPDVMGSHMDDFGIRFVKSRNGDDTGDEVDSEEEDSEEEDVWTEDIPSDWGPDVNLGDLPNYFNLGTVPTNSPKNDDSILPTGRMISFPNWIQHKVVGVKNSVQINGQQSLVPAKRKILCFFLVQDDDPSSEMSYPTMTYTGLPNTPVLTTADVPLQESPCNLPTLRFLLSIACERRAGRNLPPEISEHILKFVDLGLTRGQAEQNRRSLMDDRRIKNYRQDIWEQNYSLCEH